MNAKTAKLINKYSRTFNENSTELKRLWNAQNDYERGVTRITMLREIESNFWFNKTKNS